MPGYSSARGATVGKGKDKVGFAIPNDVEAGPADVVLPADASESMAADVLVENASRFAARLAGGSATGKKTIFAANGRRMSRILGLGNPLLDVSAVVELSFFTKHKLEVNGACVFQPEYQGVFDFLKQHETATYVPGGSCLNTMRVVQWLTKVPRATSYLGTVGNDEYGKELRKEAQKDGLFFPELLHPTLNTGTCAVLIEKQSHQRSLIANLGASCHFTELTLEAHPEVRRAVLEADIFYCEGFVFNASPQSIYKLAYHAKRENKTFALNMSACFVPAVHKAHLIRMLPYTHYLFGNGAEALAYAEAMEWDIDTTSALEQLTELNGKSEFARVAAAALRLSLEPLADPERSRFVILTQGADATIMACRGKLKLFTPPEICDEDIVDTNGSGDSFVGGFLARLAMGYPIQDCVVCGHKAAKEMLKTSGCTLPEVCPACSL